ncbi:MAG: hypothetical protein KBT48_06200, partial [Firmicutes bacterium]|nr:hypothetical protein [Bacillota bacterium]
PCAMFGKNVIDGSFLHLTYYLANMNFMAYFTSFFLYMFAFYCLIAQFKYLRLEDHYKAKNPVFLWFKVLLISAIMIGISYLGFIGIKFVFNVK